MGKSSNEKTESNDERLRRIISRAAREMSGISQRADEYMTRAKKRGAHISYQKK